MKTFEYRIDTYRDDASVVGQFLTHFDVFRLESNLLGNAGWELVTCSFGMSYITAVFQRERS